MFDINWKGETIAIATSHRKEEVIAPIVEELLNADTEVISDFKSDDFGTFSGEKERVGSALDAARLKCERAIEMSGLPIAIASEGSFGPHPHIGFVPVDEELIFFFDRKNKIEASFREISLKTNYGFTETTNWEDVKAFAEKSMFPSHALIVSSSESGEPYFVKGIQSWDVLRTTFDDLNNHGSAVKIQTDMRAMFNPTRMQVIEAAVLGLVNQLKTCCDGCGYPNFHIKEVKRGLPCASCGFPTQSVLSYVFRCESCDFTKENLFPKGKSVEDAMYCDCCNP